MKLVVEEQDIKEVVTTLFEGIDVLLTDQQARELIESDVDVAASLYECQSDLDTVSREHLYGALVTWVMKGSPPPKNVGFIGWGVQGQITGDRWIWPERSSSEAYEEEFTQAFRKTATKKGITVGESWYD